MALEVRQALEAEDGIMILAILGGCSQALKECLTYQGTDRIRISNRTFGPRITRNGSKKSEWNSNNKKIWFRKTTLITYIIKQMEAVK